MKKQPILKFGISSLLIGLLSLTGIAQETKVTDSVSLTRNYGLRVGLDISKPIRSFLDDEYSGLELVADYRITENLYIAGEIGTEERTLRTDYLDVTAQGSYFKAGVDYNVYQNWLDMDNMIFGGIRVGASTFSQTINSFTVYTTDQYWEPQFTDNSAQEFKGLTALWTELILGLKAELFNNVYMGANIQFKYMLSQNQPDNFENLYVPGFNKTYDSSKFGVGFGYNISYLIPLYKKGN